MNLYKKHTPTLDILPPKEAEQRGFVSITNDINIKTESEIINSIENSMRGIIAVWIESIGNAVQLGRLSREANVILNTAGTSTNW